jgi:two-component system, OmpR family, sensor histidine kinase KdpD
MVGATAQQQFERAAMQAAHESMGPLSTVAAAIELLATSVDPDDADAQEALDLARRQLRLVQLQLGRLGRLRSGVDEPTLEPTDLKRLVEQLVRDLEASVLASHPTTVEADRPVEVDIDPDQVRGLLYNLLTNAAKYSPAGRDIRILLDVRDDEVQIRVRDRGHGVAPSDAERIFERYERADHGSTTGAGLGLPLARETARAHRGELSLEPAQKDAGSTFLLTLPLSA